MSKQFISSRVLFVLQFTISIASFGQGSLWQNAPLNTHRTLYEVEDFKNQGVVTVGDSGFISVKKNADWLNLQAPTTRPLISAERLISSNGDSNLIINENGEAFSLSENSESVVVSTIPGSIPITQKLKRLVNLNIIDAEEIRHGLACDSGTVHAYKSNWVPPHFESNLSTHKPVNDLYPYSAWFILAVGDSGKIWRATSLQTPFIKVFQNVTTQKLNRICGLENDSIWIVGNQGTVLYSNDGGVVWNLLDVPTTNNLNGGCVSDSTVWVCGDHGLVMHKARHEPEWTIENTGITDNLYDIKSIGSKMYACGENGKLMILNKLTANQKQYQSQKPGIKMSSESIELSFDESFSGNVELFSTNGRKLLSCENQNQNRMQINLPSAKLFFVVIRENNKSPLIMKAVSPW